MELKFNKTKYLKWLKNNSLSIIYITLFIIFLYEIFFLFNIIREQKIDDSQITSRQVKIKESSYQEIIKKDAQKRNIDLEKISQLRDPFQE